MKPTFLELLKIQYDFPSDYLFKFVVKVEKLEEFLSYLDIKSFDQKESSGGKYISVTFSWKMNCAEDVVKVYQKAAEFDGVISL